MPTKDPGSKQLRALHKRAESILTEKLERQSSSLSPREFRKLFHEFQTYQIEMEQKNEELHRVQAEFEKSWAKFFDLYESAPIGFFTISNEDLILEANNTGADMLGVEKGDLIKKRFSNYIAPEYQDWLYYHRKRCFETGTKQTCELKLVKKDGEAFYVQLETIAGQDGNGDFKLLQTAIMDISERKRAETRTLLANERLQYLLRSTAVVIYTIKSRGDYGTTFISNNVPQLFGYGPGDFLRKSSFWIDHIHPDDVHRIVADLPHIFVHESFVHEYRFRCKGGDYIWIRDAMKLVRDKEGRPLEIIGYRIDITEHKENEKELAGYRAHLEEVVEKRTEELKKANTNLQEEISERIRMEGDLLKAQKLESVGVLAGGIAHDFNNILMAIGGNISLTKRAIMFGERGDDYLEQVEKACHRAKDLAQQLITFSEGGVPVKKPTSFSKLLHDTINLVLCGSKIKSEVNVPDDLWVVSVDEGQISQVLNNLLLNAIQATKGGGIIRIGAENIVLAKENELHLNPGKYIKFFLQDYGIGIEKENISKVFDPYFTTKSQGSGMGLAVSYSIINKHDGHINVESEPGRGTIFQVYLPATEATILKTAPNVQEIAFGEGKILVMDDEEIVRDIIGQFLLILGYNVEFAENGIEAIDLYRRSLESGERYEAVILDLTVPGGIGGKETIKELLEIDPEVKAIVSSGYSNDPVMANCEQYGFSGVIPKPYEIESLSQILKKVIVDSC